MKYRTVIAAALVGALAMPMPPARGEMFAMQRDEVRAQLAARGVDAAQLEARVAALSDEEAATLARRIDELPAGGRAEALVFALGVVIFVTGAVLAARAANGPREAVQ